jgi:hypothetical protein
MKWMHDGKEFDVKFKYLREAETVTQKKLREADEFVNAIGRMLNHIGSLHNSGVIVKPSDTKLDQFYKRHKYSGSIIGLVVSFGKGSNIGWSVVSPEPCMIPHYKYVNEPVLNEDGTQKVEPINDRFGHQLVNKDGTKKTRLIFKKVKIQDSTVSGFDSFDFETGMKLAYERSLNGTNYDNSPSNVRSQIKEFIKECKARGK